MFLLAVHLVFVCMCVCVCVRSAFGVCLSMGSSVSHGKVYCEWKWCITIVFAARPTMSLHSIAWRHLTACCINIMMARFGHTTLHGHLRRSHGGSMWSDGLVAHELLEWIGGLEKFLAKMFRRSAALPVVAKLVTKPGVAEWKEAI